jgi:hypothetical protein
MSNVLKLNNMQKNELINNLECCGNCLKYQTRGCLFHHTYLNTGFYPMPDRICTEYISDGMIKEMRLI